MQKIAEKTLKSDKWRQIIDTCTVIHESDYGNDDKLRISLKVGTNLASALYRRGSLKGVRLG
ncbi:hypothetical protein ACFOQM_23565 [Paenibacillus sp. GCM10012307]|uniref:Uncharacterized protein n=1 Tax=Paenibacillus roseus TaxID=2798579 RepID=A0A934J3R8_9BACL|nr:hypothetical protein [Paenibacillus roseus]MBJ6364202.1 hypothetical protein [Paenibacillus roseus]